MHALHQLYRPFSPPAPPVPREEQDPDGQHDRASPAARSVPPVAASRSFSSVLTIRESTHGDGHTTYEAHTTPFVQVRADQDPAAALRLSGDVKTEDSTACRPPSPSPSPPRFLERMHERQLRFDAHRQSLSELYAISVRRQRKLKMKKHKHKKLLRRTRNLRRKMDKA
ncbi:hypothetical protein KEM52_004167 [Ascosphaera acerosa]|nr:hypothetical protein KEM52_004167 [Ascosphaera acerosa]